MRISVAPARTTDDGDTGQSEEHLFVRNGQYLLNPHNHTTASDGAHRLDEVAGFAERHSVNIAITDHNIPPPSRNGRLAPGLIAGIEVLTREGVDVVVLGGLQTIHAWFEECIRTRLHERNPRFRPTQVSIHDLLDSIHGKSLWVIHPHYATVEGLSMLPVQAQCQALQQARTQTFIEVNAMMTRTANDIALAVAKEWALPVITCGDTHCEERQHVGTYSAIPVNSVQPGTEPLSERILAALHDRADHSADALYKPTLREKLGVGMQVVRSNGPRVIALYAAKASGRALGALPAPNKTNIPKRPTS